MFFLLNSKTVFIFLISCLLSAGVVVHFSTTGSPPSQPPSQKPVHDVPQKTPEKTTFPMFVVNYPYVQIPFEITLWVLLASFAKIGKQTHMSFTQSLKMIHN